MEETVSNVNLKYLIMLAKGFFLDNWLGPE